MMRLPPPTGLPERQGLPGLTREFADWVRARPWRVWFVLAVAALPAIAIPSVSLARYTTTSSGYCLSCHATGETPNRGIRSLVHPDFERVSCVDCHAKPGQIVFEGYVKGFMAEPERVSPNCVRCHAGIAKTNEDKGFKYNFLNIRIPHQAHLERGATCTTCHANVAHDLEVPQTNRPRMQSCYACHAVTDTCTKCHTKSIPQASLPVPAPASAGMLGDGRVYYMRICSACHGPQGDRLPQANLRSAEFLAQRGDDALRRAIAQGRGVMHGFGQESGGPLAADPIRAILGYLKEEAVGGPPPNAQALYNRNCVVCHGQAGDKVAGVRLNAPNFWAQRSDSSAYRAMEGGKGGMPAFGRAVGGTLSRQDIEAVLNYLRTQAGAAPTVDAKALYDKYCAACHGPTGGQIPSANLASAELLQRRGDESLTKSTREGVGSMPAFGAAKGGPLKDDEAKAIVQYLKTLAGAPGAAVPPAPPPAPSPPPESEALYAKYCAACHGQRGDRLPSANLASKEFQRQRGEAELRRGTAEGKGGMPAMSKAKGGPMTDEEIEAVLQYLKTLAGG